MTLIFSNENRILFDTKTRNKLLRLDYNNSLNALFCSAKSRKAKTDFKDIERGEKSSTRYKTYLSKKTKQFFDKHWHEKENDYTMFVSSKSGFAKQNIHRGKSRYNSSIRNFFHQPSICKSRILKKNSYRCCLPRSKGQPVLPLRKGLLYKNPSYPLPFDKSSLALQSFSRNEILSLYGVQVGQTVSTQNFLKYCFAFAFVFAKAKVTPNSPCKLRFAFAKAKVTPQRGVETRSRDQSEYPPFLKLPCSFLPRRGTARRGTARKDTQEIFFAQANRDNNNACTSSCAVYKHARSASLILLISFETALRGGFEYFTFSSCNTSIKWREKASNGCNKALHFLCHQEKKAGFRSSENLFAMPTLGGRAACPALALQSRASAEQAGLGGSATKLSPFGLPSSYSELGTQTHSGALTRMREKKEMTRLFLILTRSICFFKTNLFSASLKALGGRASCPFGKTFLPDRIKISIWGLAFGASFLLISVTTILQKQEQNHWFFPFLRKQMPGLYQIPQESSLECFENITRKYIDRANNKQLSSVKNIDLYKDQFYIDFSLSWSQQHRQNFTALFSKQGESIHSVPFLLQSRTAQKRRVTGQEVSNTKVCNDLFSTKKKNRLKKLWMVQPQYQLHARIPLGRRVLQNARNKNYCPSLNPAGFALSRRINFFQSENFYKLSFRDILRGKISISFLPQIKIEEYKKRVDRLNDSIPSKLSPSILEKTEQNNTNLVDSQSNLLKKFFYRYGIFSIPNRGLKVSSQNGSEGCVSRWEKRRGKNHGSTIGASSTEQEEIQPLCDFSIPLDNLVLPTDEQDDFKPIEKLTRSKPFSWWQSHLPLRASKNLEGKCPVVPPGPPFRSAQKKYTNIVARTRTATYSETRKNRVEEKRVSTWANNIAIETIANHVFYKQNTITNRFMSGYQVPERKALQLKSERSRKDLFIPFKDFFKIPFLNFATTKTSCFSHASKNCKQISSTKIDKISRVPINTQPGKADMDNVSIKVAPALPFYESKIKIFSAYQKNKILAVPLLAPKGHGKKGHGKKGHGKEFVPFSLPLLDMAVRAVPQRGKKLLSSQRDQSTGSEKEKEQKGTSKAAITEHGHKGTQKVDPIKALKKMPYRELSLRCSSEVKPLFEQVNGSTRISPYRLFFKNLLFADYNDYLSWQKDTPTAISISPSLEEDKAIKNSWQNEGLPITSLPSSDFSLFAPSYGSPEETLTLGQDTATPVPSGQGTAWEEPLESEAQNKEKFDPLSSPDLVEMFDQFDEKKLNLQERLQRSPSYENKEHRENDPSLYGADSTFSSSKNSESQTSSETPQTISEEEDKKREITKFEWLLSVRDAEQPIEESKNLKRSAFPNRKALSSKRLLTEQGKVQNQLVQDRKDSFFGIANIFPKRLVAQDQKQINDRVLQRDHETRSRALSKQFEFEKLPSRYFVQGDKNKIFVEQLLEKITRNELEKGLKSERVLSNQAVSAQREAREQKESFKPRAPSGQKGGDEHLNRKALYEKKRFISKRVAPRSVETSDRDSRIGNNQFVQSIDRPFEESNPPEKKEKRQLDRAISFFSFQHPIYTPNRRLRLRVAQSSLSSQSNNLESRIDDLHLGQSHRWWQKRRITSSLLGAPSKRYLVMPEISTQDWRKMIEWQLKTYFLEEEKRLQPLFRERIRDQKTNFYEKSVEFRKLVDLFPLLDTSTLYTPKKPILEEPFPALSKNSEHLLTPAVDRFSEHQRGTARQWTQEERKRGKNNLRQDEEEQKAQTLKAKELFKIKKIAIYLPWTTLKKSLKKPFEWPLTGLSYESNCKWSTNLDTNSLDLQKQRLGRECLRTAPYGSTFGRATALHSLRFPKDELRTKSIVTRGPSLTPVGLGGFATCPLRSSLDLQSRASAGPVALPPKVSEGPKGQVAKPSRVSVGQAVLPPRKSFLKNRKSDFCFVSSIQPQFKTSSFLPYTFLATKGGKETSSQLDCNSSCRKFTVGIIKKQLQKIDRPFAGMPLLSLAPLGLRKVHGNGHGNYSASSRQVHLYKPFLFERVTKHSHLLLHQLLLAVALKQFFYSIYKVFGKIIISRIKDSSLAIAFLPIFLNADSRSNSVAIFYNLKKRFKDLVGSEDTISSLSEIVWSLRNSCRGRMVPRGVVLVETVSSETTDYLKAIGGEAQVPVIVQSLRALPFTQNHPQRRLEKILTFAQKKAPCILFLDDLDAIGESRTLLLKNNSNDDPSLSSSLDGTRAGANGFCSSKILGAPFYPHKGSHFCFSKSNRTPEGAGGSDIKSVTRSKNGSVKRNHFEEFNSFSCPFLPRRGTARRGGWLCYQEKRKWKKSKKVAAHSHIDSPCKLGVEIRSLPNRRNTGYSHVQVRAPMGQLRSKEQLLFSSRADQKSMCQLSHAVLLDRFVSNNLPDKCKWSQRKYTRSVSGLTPKLLANSKTSDTFLTGEGRDFSIESFLVADTTRSENERIIEQRRLDLMLRLLTVMDGITHLNGVLIVTTSKNPSQLDPALLRPGRFERLISIEPPNKKRRIELLKVETRKIGHTNPMPWEYFGTRTQNMTGREIASATNHSAFRAIIQSTVHTPRTLEYGIGCVNGEEALSSLHSEQVFALAKTSHLYPHERAIQTSFLSQHLSFKARVERHTSYPRSFFRKTAFFLRKICKKSSVESLRGSEKNVGAFHVYVSNPEGLGGKATCPFGPSLTLGGRATGPALALQSRASEGPKGQVALPPRPVGVSAGQAAQTLLRKVTPRVRGIKGKHSDLNKKHLKEIAVHNPYKNTGVPHGVTFARAKTIKRMDTQIEIADQQVEHFKRSRISFYKAGKAMIETRLFVKKIRDLKNKKSIKRAQLKKDETSDFEKKGSTNARQKFEKIDNLLYKKRERDGYYSIEPCSTRNSVGFFAGQASEALYLESIARFKNRSFLFDHIKHAHLLIVLPCTSRATAKAKRKFVQTGTGNMFVSPYGCKKGAVITWRPFLAIAFAKTKVTLGSRATCPALVLPPSFAPKRHQLSTKIDSPCELGVEPGSQPLLEATKAPSVARAKFYTCNCLPSSHKARIRKKGKQEAKTILEKPIKLSYYDLVSSYFYIAFQNSTENRELLDLLADHLIRFKALRLHEIMRISSFYFDLNVF